MTDEEKTLLVQDGLAPVTEAQKFTSLSRSTLYQLMASGQLVFVRLGRSRRIPRRALVDLAASNLRGGWRVDEG